MAHREREGGDMPTLQALEDALVDLIRTAVVELPSDVVNKLQEAYDQEDDPVPRMQLHAILDNIALAKETNTPLCQDTGVPLFYVTRSQSLSLPLEATLANAIERATERVPLRPNAVDPLSRKNPGTNTGPHMPHITYAVHDKPYTEITMLPKGAGSENMSVLRMLTPSQGVNGIKESVLDAVVSAGGKPCPPTIVGVGIGGSADIATSLAKHALLRPLGTENPDERLAKLEEELTAALNETGIGPMGLGGKTTVLGVHAELAACHTASHPVAINLQCWAARRATIYLYDDGRIEYV
jgi:fumarate hydratase subunit alpha